jgi:hypothetical protein
MALAPAFAKGWPRRRGQQFPGRSGPAHGLPAVGRRECPGARGGRGAADLPAGRPAARRANVATSRS